MISEGEAFKGKLLAYAATANVDTCRTNNVAGYRAASANVLTLVRDLREEEYLCTGCADFINRYAELTNECLSRCFRVKDNRIISDQKISAHGVRSIFVVFI